MSNIAVHAEGVGKKYRLGAQSGPYKTIRESVMSLAGAPVSVARRLTRRSDSADAGGRRPEFWALKDVNFEVKQGEVLGIIGRNGAGKSTLLKLLSQITEPTEGRITVRGRLASLLEVGTGFHPELTGRENIFLNGAILGMARSDISRKFDEIVAFAEVEKFIDTQVKRYSSGMYLRLAFAVAAHLEPEILVIDEVLAVGDAQFQEKCLGKMSEVSAHGRTVLFVSHNMQAIMQLTHRCIILVQGQCRFDGPTSAALTAYNALYASGPAEAARYEAPPRMMGNHMLAARVQTSELYGVHRWGESIVFEFTLQVPEPREGLSLSIQVVNNLQQPVCHFWHLNADAPYQRQAGTYVLRCHIPKFRLYMGTYTLTTYLADRRGNALIESLAKICPFEVTMQGTQREEYAWAPGACVYLEENTWELANEATVS